MNHRFVLLLIGTVFLISSCVSNRGNLKILNERVQILEEQNMLLTEALQWELGFDADTVLEQKRKDLTVYNIPQDGSWAIGPANAEIVLVEFSDLECPYSAESSIEIYDLIQAYGDKVRFVFKHFPLSYHQNAPNAHAAMLAAGKQGKFWDYRFNIPIYFNDLSDENLIDIAQYLKLNITRFKTDMEIDDEDLARFSRDRDLALKIGVEGTPSFFINGQRTYDPTRSILALLAGEKPVTGRSFITNNCKQ
jgi:protein-disulfide isomerase